MPTRLQSVWWGCSRPTIKCQPPGMHFAARLPRALHGELLEHVHWFVQLSTRDNNRQQTSQTYVAIDVTAAVQTQSPLQLVGCWLAAAIDSYPRQASWGRHCTATHLAVRGHDVTRRGTCWGWERWDVP